MVVVVVMSPEKREKDKGAAFGPGGSGGSREKASRPAGPPAGRPGRGAGRVRAWLQGGSRQSPGSTAQRPPRGSAEGGLTGRPPSQVPGPVASAWRSRRPPQPGSCLRCATRRGGFAAAARGPAGQDREGARQAKDREDLDSSSPSGARLFAVCAGVTDWEEALVRFARSGRKQLQEKTLCRPHASPAKGGAQGGAVPSASEGIELIPFWEFEESSSCPTLGGRGTLVRIRSHTSDAASRINFKAERREGGGCAPAPRGHTRDRPTDPPTSEPRHRGR